MVFAIPRGGIVDFSRVVGVVMVEHRIFLPDLGKPELALRGVAVNDSEKGSVLSFVTDPANAMLPDFPGVPRLEILQKFDGIKSVLKIMIDAMHKQFAGDFIQFERLPPAVKEIHRGFDYVIAHEPYESGKEFWTKIRDLVCLFLYEDTSYRWRMQFATEVMDIKKLRLSDNDRFWFRTRGDFRCP